MGDIDAEPAAEVAIDTRIDPEGVPIVAITGELDSSNASSNEAAIASVAAAHPDRLIFDLSGLRFMDSAGIAVLVGIAASVKSVQLRDPSQTIRRVIDVTGLSNILPIES